MGKGKALSRRREVASEERLRELEEKYEGYTVYDNQGSKIGKVDDLFVDERDHEEYIGVKLGFLGRKSTLIPTEIVRVNENDRTIEVSESKDRVKDAPSFDDDEDVTSEYEERIRRHFGLETSGSSSRGGYDSSSTGSAAAGAATGAAAGSSTGEHGTRDDEETGTAEQPAAGYDEAEHRSSGDTQSTDTEGANTEEHSFEATGATDHSDRPSGESVENRETSSADESGGTEHRDDEAARDSGPEGSTLGGGGTQGTPISRQTEETETFEEGGRAKIRRRIVREEVEDADEDTGRSQ